MSRANSLSHSIQVVQSGSFHIQNTENYHTYTFSQALCFHTKIQWKILPKETLKKHAKKIKFCDFSKLLNMSFVDYTTVVLPIADYKGIQDQLSKLITYGFN